MPGVTSGFTEWRFSETTMNPVAEPARVLVVELETWDELVETVTILAEVLLGKPARREGTARVIPRSIDEELRR